MNIDFTDDDSSGIGWWSKDSPPVTLRAKPGAQEGNADVEISYDFSGELQQYARPVVYQDFQQGGPEDIDVFDAEDEARQDAVLANLTNMAYGGAINRIPLRRRENPFFYHRTQSFYEKVGEQKRAAEPQVVAIEHIDGEVEERLKTYEKELSVELAKNIECVREFFLKEMDPLSLGVQGGTAQVHALMLRLFPDGIDTEQFSQFVHMAKQARKIKMARFIATYMQLDPEDAERIADGITPRKEVMVIGPNADERIHSEQQARMEELQKGAPPKRLRTRDRIRMAGERERATPSEISVSVPRGGI